MEIDSSLALFLMFVFFVFGILFGGGAIHQGSQQQAVEHQCATWEVKPDGSTEFKWLEKQQ